MGFYDLAKDVRDKLVVSIYKEIEEAIVHGKEEPLFTYFNDEDTYIRKTAYLAIGKLYFINTKLQDKILHQLNKGMLYEEHKVRQTSINAAGEIGKKDFNIIEPILDKGLFDVHHSPRNAVIGSIKKIGEVNPIPCLAWARKYLHHQDKEIRREICHGIELRGRKYPQDILPLLKELQYDKTARVRNTLVHVIGQIAYKKGCLQTVIADLKTWENKEVVAAALVEIIDVHHRYRNFAVLTQEEARQYIQMHF